MSNDNVIKLISPGTFTDHLTEILRNGSCAGHPGIVSSRKAGLKRRMRRSGSSWIKTEPLQRADTR